MFTTTCALAGLSLIVAVSAVPDVTVVPLTKGCASYPGYDASTGVAGPWIVQLDSSGTKLDTHGDISSYVLGDDGKIKLGYINIPVNNQEAKTPIQCADGVLQGRVATDLTTYAWQPLVAATSVPDSAFFGYMLPGDNSAVEPYAHYLGDVKQDGVFLGANNITTWAFTPTSAAPWGEYYMIRLVNPGLILNEGEFIGFIKVPA